MLLSWINIGGSQEFYSLKSELMQLPAVKGVALAEVTWQVYRSPPVTQSGLANQMLYRLNLKFSVVIKVYSNDGYELLSVEIL